MRDLLRNLFGKPLVGTPAALSDTGLVRRRNEDAYIITGDGGMMFVCDGMGGMPGGQECSTAAIQAFAQRWHGGTPPKHRKAIVEWFQESARQAHLAMQAVVRDQPSLQRMATTAVGAIRTGDRLMVANCGDSRAYLLSEGRLSQITVDHENERGAVTRYIAAEQYMEFEISEIHLRPGDVFLLCSDGLFGVVDDQKIQQILSQDKPSAQMCEDLVNASIVNGAPDNVTVVVMKMEQTGS